MGKAYKTGWDKTYQGNSTMKHLDNWHYWIVMSIGGDEWRLTGTLRETGRIIHTSTPVSFDEITMTVVTLSGSNYKLGNCKGKLSTQIGYIRKDIDRINKELLDVVRKANNQKA